jgi:hypothetical protein
MPQFLEDKLENQYGQGDPRVYKTMNALGYMKGSKETPKGKAAQAAHEQKPPPTPETKQAQQRARASRVKQALKQRQRV